MPDKPIVRGSLGASVGRVIGEAIPPKQRAHPSRVKCAEFVGVDVQTLTRWIKGTAAIPVDGMALVAAYLDRSPVDLLAEAQRRMLLRLVPSIPDDDGIPSVPESSAPHQGKSSVIPSTDDVEDDAAADESPDEDAMREERGE